MLSWSYLQKLLFNSFKSQNMNATRSNTWKHWRLTRHVSQLWQLFHYLCTAKPGLSNFSSEHSGEILYILVIYKIPVATTSLRFSFSWRKPKLKQNNQSVEFQDNITMIEMLQDFISVDLESQLEKPSLTIRLWHNHPATYPTPFAN